MSHISFSPSLLATRSSFPTARKRIALSKYQTDAFLQDDFLHERDFRAFLDTLPRLIASNRLITQRLRRIDINYRSPIVHVSNATIFLLSRLAQPFLYFQFPRIHVMHRVSFVTVIHIYRPCFPWCGNKQKVNYFEKVHWSCTKISRFKKHFSSTLKGSQSLWLYLILLTSLINLNKHVT